MTFFPHLLNLLTHPHVAARVLLSAVEVTALGRKALAQQLYWEACRLKSTELISTAQHNDEPHPITAEIVAVVGIN